MKNSKCIDKTPLIAYWILPIFRKKMKGSGYERDSYHHGNLKESLLKEGLSCLKEHGEKGLSFREIAKRCKVSSAAPYAHFANKEDFIESLREEIMKELTLCLKTSADKHRRSKMIIAEMGVAYVLFFLQRPNYFSLFFKQSRHIEAILWEEEEITDHAFLILKEEALPIFRMMGMDESKQKNLLLSLWIQAHGLAAVTSLPEISTRLLKEDYEKRIRTILTGGIL